VTRDTFWLNSGNWFATEDAVAMNAGEISNEPMVSDVALSWADDATA
jgi:hypothetical protein